MTTATTGSRILIPRFATPRDERFPTLGPQVGEVARRLGRPLMAWQQAAIDVAYEYDPDTGLFRYDEADITVPRQSGKTTITLAKKVHRLTVLARVWGPQRSTYTAQTRLAARKKLERDFAEVLRAARSFREVPNSRARPTKPTEWRLSLNNGSESIQFGDASFLQIDAPKRTSGHGDTLDDGTIDEAFAHEDDTVEGAMRPAMATRRNAQLWVISTAGDVRSRYLWRKVLAGRAATDSGEHGRTCYIEYSAPDDADPADPATWLDCMPAVHQPDCPLGCTEHTTPLAFVQSEWERAQRKGQEGIDTFRRAYLNQWPDIPALDGGDGWDVIPKDVWADGYKDAPAGDPAALGVDMTWDRDWASLAWSVSGYVDIHRHARGSAWVVQECQRVQGRYPDAAVWVDAKGPAAPLIQPLRDAGVRVEEVRGDDRRISCGAFRDAANSRAVSHSNDPDLDAAVAGAQVSATGMWDHKRGAVISPLVAANLAWWGATQAREPRIRVLD